MSTNSTKWLVYSFWIAIILLGPITILRTTSFSDAFSNPALLINFFQRITGLLAFSLLFCQILLGSFLNFWLKFLGSKTIRLHILEGLTAYGLFLTHPLLYVIFNYQVLGKLTLFLWPSLDINTPIYELYLTYGRIGFVLLSIGVFAGYFRQKPFMRVHWRKFHILNYFSFFFIAMHAYNVGTDISTFPFNLFFWLAVIVISLVTFKRFIYWRLKPYLNFLAPSKPAPEH